MPRPDGTGIFYAGNLLVRNKKPHMSASENRQPEKAPAGSIPPVIRKPLGHHVCILPARGQMAPAPDRPKAAATPTKPKPEPTLEQKIADEVERRLKARTGNLLLGFILGEAFGQWWDKHHHRD